MKQRALIDIHTVLDTRLGILAQMDPQVAEQIVHSDWYPVRDTDRFDLVSDGKIDLDTYATIKSEYRTETLLNSLMTDFIYHLRKDLEEVYPKQGIYDLDDVIRFDINVWPYKLHPSEKEMIRRGIGRYLTAPGQVQVVDLRWDLVTPAFVDTNYEMLALYDYEDWLKFHDVALKDHPIRDILLFHPRIAPSGVVPEPDDVFGDPFMVVPLVLCHVLQVRPIDTAWVCWNPKIYAELTQRVKGENPQGSEDAPLAIVPQDGTPPVVVPGSCTDHAPE